jgi:hypothetical protein
MQLTTTRTRLARLLAREDGQSLMMVMFLIAALTLLTPLLISSVTSSATEANNSLVQTRSRAAADAGINDYVAKLLLDNQYYLQYLAPGEATRRPTSGADVSSVLPPSSPTPWPTANGRTWTYPSKDAWVDLGNGYSYDLEVAAPNTGTNTSNAVQIVATGKPTVGGTTADHQVVQVLIRPASVADFQMLANASISYGSDASTYGKIYTTKNLDFQGTAYADLYAEGDVTLSGSVVSPAKWYDHNTSPTIRSVIKSPVNFADFQVSLTDIKRAAANAGGIYLNNPNVSAWQVVFNSNGTFTFKSCRSQYSAIEKSQPTCDGSISNLNTSLLGGAGSGTVSIPGNGAVYSDQSIVIGPGSSSCGSPSITNGNCVHGRVTVASGQDVVVGDDIEYVDRSTDVLGLIAQNNVYVAAWTGSSLTWRAASLAENGWWGQPQSGVSNNSHSGTMTFNGSTGTNTGGAMSMFATRVYNYDTNLQYLQPPWYPTLQQAYTILLYRSLPNGS